MVRLTEDMTRLAAEIFGHHTDRNRLMRDIKQVTAAMKRTVAQTMSHSHAARAVQTRGQQKRLRAFALNLRETIGGMRTSFAGDLAGAHVAWFGGPKPEARVKAGRGHEQSRGKA
jgi:hypothetical protein